MVCFVHFDVETCFAPQRRALFRHLNFQKWSERGVMGVTFQGEGSYLLFYSLKRWVPTPLGVYKLKVPTPLRHYNLNTVAPNQNPEINRKKPSDYKMAGADPPKKNSYNETAC